MNKLMKMMLGVAALATVSLSANEGGELFRPYAKVGFGVQKPSKREKIEYKVGMVGNVALGVAYDAWRMELEGGYRQSKIKKINNVEAKNIKAKALSTMVNLYYDYSLTEECFVYVGLGLGIASVKTTFDTGAVAPFAPATQVQCEAGKLAFAWQVMAGIGYDINTNWTIEAGYRCFNTSKIKAPKVGQAAAKKFKQPFCHTLELGLRYSF